jgi:hypothetical protein
MYDEHDVGAGGVVVSLLPAGLLAFGGCSPDALIGTVRDRIYGFRYEPTR